MKNNIAIFAVIVAVVLGGLFVLKSNKAPATVSPSPTPQNSTGEYTLAEVSAHNSKASCWTTINGGVYDLTDWISRHPGGMDAILGLCGIDGSAAFNAQHGGKTRPEAELASFKIGVLK